MDIKVNFIVIVVFIMSIFTVVFASIQRNTHIMTDLIPKQESQQQTTPAEPTSPR